MPKAQTWRNRIIGYGEEAPDQLLANPRNWRIHPKPQQDALAGVLGDIGWIEPIIVNKTTGFVVDGHLRAQMAISHGDAAIPVCYVELTEAEEAEALATLDPLAGMAAADKEQLDGLLRDVQSGEAAVQAMLSDLAEKSGLQYGDEDNTYSRKIESPVYEPSGEKPDVSALFDDSKTQELIASIDKTEGLTDEERHFLRIAAQRHTVLHFNKIADYYAHSDADRQRLMEDSALVIIDFQRAIELGFVRLTKDIAQQVKDEYGQ
jgi:hypothetical protein